MHVKDPQVVEILPETSVARYKLTRYFKDNGLYPHTMIGFWAKLSTQDAVKLLKHYVIDHNTQDMRAILGLDLEKALRNIAHSLVLRSIAELGLGDRFYEYTKSFLTHRKATLRTGDLVSEEIELRSRGTPQGSMSRPPLNLHDRTKQEAVTNR